MGKMGCQNKLTKFTVCVVVVGGGGVVESPQTTTTKPQTFSVQEINSQWINLYLFTQFSE